MMRQLVWIGLALSLLFNVFFAAGYLKARAAADRADGDAGTPARVVEALGLDRSQADIFTRLQSELREDTAALDGAMALARESLTSELDKQSPDLERVRQIITETAELNEQRHRAGAQRFHEFLGVLSPEQRRRLSRTIERGPHGRRMQRMLESFDADGDGTLGAGERAEAERFFEQMRRDRERRRQELQAQFDVDGDGTLSREEQQALREHRRREIEQRFDADGDGRLGPEEERAMHEWMRERSHRGRGGPPGAGRPGSESRPHGHGDPGAGDVL